MLLLLRIATKRGMRGMRGSVGELSRVSAGHRSLGCSLFTWRNFAHANTMAPPDDDPVFVASIDQGTTSSRVLIFSRTGEPVAAHHDEFPQLYPHPGCACPRPPPQHPRH